jgi:hypothetical protein
MVSVEGAGLVDWLDLNSLVDFLDEDSELDNFRFISERMAKMAKRMSM